MARIIFVRGRKGPKGDTGAYTSEEVTINGTTQVSTTQTHWGEVFYCALDSECVGTITIREASGNATIATIAPGSLIAGTEMSMDEPVRFAIAHPNIEWHPIPDDNYTGWQHYNR